MTALKFPKVMEFLPTLFPRHFRRLIGSSSEEVLQRIEEALGTHPWKLGFRRVSQTFIVQHSVILDKARLLQMWPRLNFFLLRIYVDLGLDFFPEGHRST